MTTWGRRSGCHAPLVGREIHDGLFVVCCSGLGSARDSGCGRGQQKRHETRSTTRQAATEMCLRALRDGAADIGASQSANERRVSSTATKEPWSAHTSSRDLARAARIPGPRVALPIELAATQWRAHTLCRAPREHSTGGSKGKSAEGEQEKEEGYDSSEEEGEVRSNILKLYFDRSKSLSFPNQHLGQRSPGSRLAIFSWSRHAGGTVFPLNRRLRPYLAQLCVTCFLLNFGFPPKV